MGSHTEIIAFGEEKPNNYSTAKMVERISAHTPDIIIGGPPCQDFSQAGKRQEGERANLTECFAHIVKSVRPKWFLMENVDRAQRSQAYLMARKIFVKAGYGLTEKVLNANVFGVPQKPAAVLLHRTARRVRRLSDERHSPATKQQRNNGARAFSEHWPRN